MRADVRSNMRADVRCSIIEIHRPMMKTKDESVQTQKIKHKIADRSPESTNRKSSDASDKLFHK